MKKYLILLIFPLVTLSGCSKNATPQQNADYGEKVLSGKFKKEADKNKTAENLSDYNPEEVPIIDDDGNKIEWSLRQILQPGKRWVGHSDVTGNISFPSAVEFSTDGVMQFYGQDATGNWYDGTRIVIDEIAYNGWVDTIHDQDGSGEKIEIEGHEKELNRIETDSGVEQSIKKVISFSTALDKPNVLTPGDTIDWFPCGEVGVCSMAVGVDGNLIITIGPFSHYYQN
jgi:hypothetical protein